jgi:hypothetical protein
MELEIRILMFKLHAMPDSEIIRGLEHPLLGGEGIPREEIDRAYQRLRNYGWIDSKGLITDQGIDAI